MTDNFGFETAAEPAVQASQQQAPHAPPPQPMPVTSPQMPMGQAPAQVVVAKNPGVAGFLSFLWTGAGQIYNGQIGLGLGLMAIQLVNFMLMFVLIGFFTAFATWLFAIFHAYTEAQKFNASHGIIS